MAKTFEWRGGRLEAVADAPDLAVASAALPAGAYTTIRTYGGRRFVEFDEHVTRLSDSAGAPLTARELRDAVRAALDATRYPESRLRVTFAPPRLLVSVEPFLPPEAALYRDGARCVTVPLHRDRPALKDTRFLAAASSAYRSLPPGVHEGLLVADDGSLLEGLSSNLFAVIEGVLRTEGSRALPGITRSLVLEAASGLLPVDLTAPRRDELPRASECFITSASRGVMPVVEVDGVRVADGRPGPLTAELGRRFEARIAAEAREP
jgi:branched-chain amino acid aminotransferase